MGAIQGVLAVKARFYLKSGIISRLARRNEARNIRAA